MSLWRTLGTALALAAALPACSGGDDGASTSPTTAVSGATTAAPTAPGTSAPPTTAAATSAAAPTGPATTMAGTSVAPTTVDDAATGGPAAVGACTLLDAARIEAVFGGPVSAPTDLETSCEWTVGDAAQGVSDTLTLTVEGTADELADTADLLGEAGTEVPEAADGGVYWADFTTLYFVTGGRLLSLQFLAPEADDPLGGLVALANRVG